MLPSCLLSSVFIPVGLLTDTLGLLQEELRELREQPIDPQAEQEIIDSIEEVYFSNDAFDMVRHELEVRRSPCKYLIDRATPLNPETTACSRVPTPAPRGNRRGNPAASSDG